MLRSRSPRKGSLQPSQEFAVLSDEEDEKSDRDQQPLIPRSLSQRFCQPPELLPRSILFTPHSTNTEPPKRWSPNLVRNQKYSLLTFIPLVLYEQFKFFFNLYFLICALTQAIPALQVGFPVTYYGPLLFVLTITMVKEAADDFQRFRRDKEANNEKFEVLMRGISSVRTLIPSSQLKVGDIVILSSGQRVPADCVLLRTNDASGTVFLKTDQLDGETDWKLRKSIPSLQKLPDNQALLAFSGRMNVEAPKKFIYDFAGQFCSSSHIGNSGETIEPLGLENTMWTNTVIATGTVAAVVVYTGRETRSVLNASAPPSKIGLTDLELNDLSKILFCLTLTLSSLLMLLKGLVGQWFIYFFRFNLLFSSIIPISLRVNLDLAKTLYSFFIMRDDKIPDTVVRSSTIPEELGRISYLFSDKTGTLTQNVMEFKKLQLRPPLSYDKETLPLMKSQLRHVAFSRDDDEKSHARHDKDVIALKKLVTALGVCHNVTPVFDEVLRENTYQAASPDEVALVRFCESVGLALIERDETKIILRNPQGESELFEVLNIFPFTSESKRMGIIVRASGEIWFYLKGAESTLKSMIEPSDWLEEECESLAREGLRTLVFARRRLSSMEYREFKSNLDSASISLTDRQEQVRRVIDTLEHGLELLGISGVEDKLQPNVKTCLETLRNAGIKIWMLTGDKDETAKCIARSAKLVDRSQEIVSVMGKTKREVLRKLDSFGGKPGSALLVDGTTLAILMEHHQKLFIEYACEAPAVICCRCSPTQKDEIVSAMKDYTGKRCAAIGDGGNDVSMIQAAHVGIGIVGKEGKQASLAADFSIDQFSYTQRLLLWHGRNSYRRSARLSNFIMHRGTIISVIQAVFSALFFYAAIPIYTGWLIVGYATVFTNFPVFSLVLDQDVSENLVMLYPELYQELQKGRPLSRKRFFIWMLQR